MWSLVAVCPNLQLQALSQMMLIDVYLLFSSYICKVLLIIPLPLIYFLHPPSSILHPPYPSSLNLFISCNLQPPPIAIAALHPRLRKSGCWILSCCLILPIHATFISSLLISACGVADRVRGGWLLKSNQFFLNLLSPRSPSWCIGVIINASTYHSPPLKLHLPCPHENRTN